MNYPVKVNDNVNDNCQDYNDCDCVYGIDIDINIIIIMMMIKNNNDKDEDSDNDNNNDTALQFSGSYNNSSSWANLTPYSGVIFRGVILTPKRSLKNSFSGVKVTPDIEELK